MRIAACAGKDNEDYIEQKAKEDGYLHAGERVFVNISGD